MLFSATEKQVPSDSSCVQTCQGKVMYYGTPAEMATKMEEIGEKAVIFLP